MNWLRTAVWVTAFAIPVAASAQDDRFVELRFHRVYLRNGNFIDGTLLKQTAKEIALKLPYGEMIIRMDMVDHVEFIKMKSAKEAPVEVPKPKSVTPAVTDPGKRLPSVPRVVPQSSVKLDAATYEAVSTLLDKYNTADVEGKPAIIDNLIKLGGNVPAYLATILPKFNRDEMGGIAHALAQTKDPSLVPYLAAHLELPDATTRFHVIMSLGMLGSASAVPYLSEPLKDKEASVRAAGVTALGMLGGPAAFDQLLPMIQDADKDTRTRAIAVLHDLATKESRKKELGDAIAAAIPRAEPDARPDLIDAVGRGGHQTAWNVLLPYLRDESAAIRRTAAKSLADLAVPDSGDAVLAAVLGEQNTGVQAALARGVQKLALKRAGGTLILWMEKGDQEVKTASLSALTSLAGESFGSDLDKWRAWWDKNKPE